MCDEWLNSKESFFEWAKANGYDKSLVLDKDIGSALLGIEPPIYSPETCAFVTRSLNNSSRKEISSNNTSGYKGVTFVKGDNRYKAQIMINGKTIYIKQSVDKLVCAKAYNKYIDDHNLPHTKNTLGE